MLPVNCNRMMTAGACPLTFWTVIIYKLKGYKVGGLAEAWATGRFKDLTHSPHLSPSWSGKQVEFDKTTAKKIESLNGWFCIQLSLCWAYQCFFHRTPPPPIILYVIYALYATWTCVSACMCAYVCVYSSLPHVFVAPGLALSPASWLARCPPSPVMSRHAQCWNEEAAVPPHPLLLPCSWVSPVCVRWCLFLCGWSLFLVFRSFETCPLWFFQALPDLGRGLKLFSPLVFPGEMCFSDNGECFLLGQGLGCLIALRRSSTKQRSTFSSLVTFFYLLLPSSLPVAHVTLTHNLYQ